MSHKRTVRRPIAEINVVPYIDVMLVLLIIFMITAPLLNQGVEVELPESSAQPLDSNESPVVISVAKNGDLYLNTGDDSELIDAETLLTKLSAFIRRNPGISVLIGGDQSVSYGQVYAAMVLAQQAGAPKVGLMSDPLEDVPQ